MQTMQETDRRAETGRIHLAFKIGPVLTGERLRSAVEKARNGIDARDRDRIEFAPPIRVKAPLPRLAFASGCASFAVALVKHLAAAGKGGTILDLRETTPLVSRDTALTRGVVRVRVKDGTEYIHASSLSAPTLDAVLGDLLSLPQSVGPEGVGKAQVKAVLGRAHPGQGGDALTHGSVVS